MMDAAARPDATEADAEPVVLDAGDPSPDAEGPGAASESGGTGGGCLLSGRRLPTGAPALVMAVGLGLLAARRARRAGRRASRA